MEVQRLAEGLWRWTGVHPEWEPEPDYGVPREVGSRLLRGRRRGRADRSAHPVRGPRALPRRARPGRRAGRPAGRDPAHLALARAELRGARGALRRRDRAAGEVAARSRSRSATRSRAASRPSTRTSTARRSSGSPPTGRSSPATCSRSRTAACASRRRSGSRPRSRAGRWRGRSPSCSTCRSSACSSATARRARGRPRRARACASRADRLVERRGATGSSVSSITFPKGSRHMKRGRPMISVGVRVSTPAASSRARSSARPESIARQKCARGGAWSPVRIRCTSRSPPASNQMSSARIELRRHGLLLQSEQPSVERARRLRAVGGDGHRDVVQPHAPNLMRPDRPDTE